MRMDSDALKFSPQVMALAMPGESGFKAAAEGISNVGKVFNEAQEREQAAALNALKMREAEASIQGKEFENSIAGEKWANEKITHTLDRRNKMLDGMKKQLDYDTEVKKAGELEVTQKISGMLPTTLFYKEGKFDRGSLDAARGEWLKMPEWKGKEHIVNAVFDTKLKDIMAQEEQLLKNDKVQAEAFKITEEGKMVAPKGEAYIASQKSVQAKNYAGANLDNVNASLAPVKTKAYVKQTEAAAKNAGIEDKLKDDRMKITSDTLKMESMVPGYSALTDNQKLDINRRYVNDGVLPKRIGTPRQGDADYGKVDSDAVRAVYEAGAVFKQPAAAKPAAHKPAASAKPATQPKSTGGSPAIGTIKTNPKTGQKAQFDGHGWVLVQ